MDEQITRVVDRRVAEELLKRETDRLAELKLAMVDRFGDDEYDDGTVVRFQKKFTADGHPYLYAAIKAGGKWYLTGKEQSGLTWGQFVLFLVGGECMVTTWNVEFLTNKGQTYTIGAGFVPTDPAVRDWASGSEAADKHIEGDASSVDEPVNMFGYNFNLPKPRDPKAELRSEFGGE
jgi:hypothetical protein